MEHPISGWEWIPNSAIDRAEEALNDSDYPSIRIYHVPLYPSPVRLENLKAGTWELSSRKSLGKFSASAWFFAKKLHQELNIPIGIIHSSWGGTSILTWTNSKTLDEYADSVPKNQKNEIYHPNIWEQKIRAAIDSYRVRRNKISFPDPMVLNQQLKLGEPSENWTYSDIYDNNREFGFVLWLKKIVLLTQEQADDDLELNLGFLNRQSHVYLNGHELGYFQYPAQAKMTVPSDLLKSGENEIVVRLSNQWGRATIHHSQETLGIKFKARETHIPLDTGWMIAENLEFIPSALPIFVNEPSFLFNGMIAPIIPYGIRGFIWDQGSSDAGRPQLYAQLFQRLIKDWRRYWRSDSLPFLFVQNTGTYPSHDYFQKSFVRSHLREAQEKALELPNTGMVVSIDIGDPYDVHPKNKQDFGRRLALQALDKVYNLNVVSDGPYYDSNEYKGDTVILKMKDPNQQLILNCEGTDCGFELGDNAGEFFPAQTLIINNQVHLFSERKMNVKAIRYAWGDFPMTSVFNREGLPLAPFRASIVN